MEGSSTGVPSTIFILLETFIKSQTRSLLSLSLSRFDARRSQMHRNACAQQQHRHCPEAPKLCRNTKLERISAENTAGSRELYLAPGRASRRPPRQFHFVSHDFGDIHDSPTQSFTIPATSTTVPHNSRNLGDLHDSYTYSLYDFGGNSALVFGWMTLGWHVTPGFDERIFHPTAYDPRVDLPSMVLSKLGQSE